MCENDLQNSIRGGAAADGFNNVLTKSKKALLLAKYILSDPDIIFVGIYDLF